MVIVMPRNACVTVLPGNELFGNTLHGARGDGKAQARARLRGRGDIGIDANELALVVHKRTTGVAGIDGRVGLNHVGVDRARTRGVLNHIGAIHGETMPVVTVCS